MEHCSGKDHSGESVQLRWSNIGLINTVVNMLQYAHCMCCQACCALANTVAHRAPMSQSCFVGMLGVYGQMQSCGPKYKLAEQPQISVISWAHLIDSGRCNDVRRPMCI